MHYKHFILWIARPSERERSCNDLGTFADHTGAVIDQDPRGNRRIVGLEHGNGTWCSINQQLEFPFVEPGNELPTAIHHRRMKKDEVDVEADGGWLLWRGWLAGRRHDEKLAQHKIENGHPGHVGDTNGDGSSCLGMALSPVLRYHFRPFGVACNRFFRAAI